VFEALQQWLASDWLLPFDCRQQFEQAVLEWLYLWLATALIECRDEGPLCSVPPRAMGQFHLPLCRSQRLLEAGLVKRSAIGRLGPFEAPAVIQIAGIHCVETELIEQLDDLLRGLRIIRCDGQRAAVDGAAGAAVLQQVLGQDRVEHLDHPRPGQMFGEQAAGGGFEAIQRGDVPSRSG
jgi:hypothetical protein